MRIFTLCTISLIHLLILNSCSQNNSKKNNNNRIKNYRVSSSENYNENCFEEEYDEDKLEKKYEDGIHTANVEYYNPETGYRQSYTLDVEVENGEVKQIDFPNGGWLDSDHISPEEIDENGNCNIEGDNGKTYEIEIED